MIFFFVFHLYLVNYHKLLGKVEIPINNNYDDLQKNKQYHGSREDEVVELLGGVVGVIGIHLGVAQNEKSDQN